MSIENSKNDNAPRLATGSESARDNKYSFQYVANKPASEKTNDAYWKKPDELNCCFIWKDMKTKPPKDKIPTIP